MAIEMEKWVNKNKFWFALVTSLNYGGIDICLKILHDDSLPNSLPRDPSLLFKSFRKHKGFFYNLLKHGVVSLTEYNLLYNSEEEVDSSVFDLGLIITLLQGIVLPEPIDGWLHPSSEDSSNSAFLVGLRNFKDKINEMKVTNLMSELEFHDLWDELNEILHAFYFDTAILNDIFLTTTRETFYFTPPFDVKFASAFNRAKHFYLVKVINEVRELFDRHIENVTTVNTVVQNSKISKICSEISKLKKGVANMYRLHEDFMHSQHKDASPLLTVCEQLNLSIGLNDNSLDKIIAEYNCNIESKKMLNKKEMVDRKNETQSSAKQKRFTLRKTAEMSWVRRNTLTNPPTKEDLASAFQTENRNNSYENSSKGSSKDTLAAIFSVEISNLKSSLDESLKDKYLNNQENYAKNETKENEINKSVSDSWIEKSPINNDNNKSSSDKELISAFKVETNNLKSNPDETIYNSENIAFLNNQGTSTHILSKIEELAANFRSESNNTKSIYVSNSNTNFNSQDKNHLKLSNEALEHTIEAENFKLKLSQSLSTYNGINEKNLNIDNDYKNRYNNSSTAKELDTSFQTKADIANPSLEESVKKKLNNQSSNKNISEMPPKEPPPPPPPKKDIYALKSGDLVTNLSLSKSDLNQVNKRSLSIEDTDKNRFNNLSTTKVDTSFQAKSDNANPSLEESVKKNLNNQVSNKNISKTPPKVPPKKYFYALKSEDLVTSVSKSEFNGVNEINLNIEGNNKNRLNSLSTNKEVDASFQTKSNDESSTNKEVEASFQTKSNDESSKEIIEENTINKYLKNQNSYPNAFKIPPKVPPKKERFASNVKIEDKEDNLKSLNHLNNNSDCLLEKNINKNILRTDSLFKTKTFMRDGIPQSMFYDGKID